LFERPTKHIKAHGAAPFVFGADIERLVGSIRIVNEFYEFDFFNGRIARVPEVFFGLI